MKDHLYIMKFQWFLLGFAILFLTGCTTVQTTPVSQDEASTQPPKEQTISITSNEWAVRLASGVDPYQLAIEHGAQNLGQIGTLQDTYLFKRPCKILDDNGLDPLANDERVLWLEQQIARQQSKRSGAQDDQNTNECN
jgi:uncharacterized protein YceK